MSRKANIASYRYNTEQAIIAKAKRDAKQRDAAAEKKRNLERAKIMVKG